MPLLHVGVGGVSVNGWDAAGTVKYATEHHVHLKIV